MPAELLAKLTAKGIQITGAGFGGEITISADDVAAGLSGVRGGPYHFALVKYAGDSYAFTPLCRALCGRILELEAKKRQPALTDDEARLMAIACISDNLGDAICPTCNGTGRYRYAPCRGCKGAGKRPQSDSSRARFFGVTDYEYKRRIARPFSEYASLLCQWESEALARLVRNVRGGHYYDGGKMIPA